MFQQSYLKANSGKGIAFSGLALFFCILVYNLPLSVLAAEGQPDTKTQQEKSPFVILKETHERLPGVKKPQQPPNLSSQPSPTIEIHSDSTEAKKILKPQISQPFTELEILFPKEENQRQDVLKELNAIGISGLSGIDNTTDKVILEVSPDQEKALYRSRIEYKVLRYGIRLSGGNNPKDVKQ